MGDEAAAGSADDIWDDDLLGRSGDAIFLRDFIRGKIEDRRRLEQTASYVVNVDAEWGAGKTFFLDHFATQLAADGHVVARVNAWRDDHLDDPFVAILAAIDEALKPYTAKKGAVQTAWQGVKKNAIPVAGKIGAGILKTVVKKYVGKEAMEAVNDLVAESTGDDAGEDKSAAEVVLEGAVTETVLQIENVIDAGAQKLIDAFNEKNKATETFRLKLGKALEALSAKKALPLFVLVDELDRCRPSYAIALLERVKHLFDADNVAFVFATNSGELQHIVAGAYGPSFDGFSYLKRFFDRTYLLAKPEIGRFISIEASALDRNKVRAPNDLLEFLKLGFKSYGSNLREIKHAFDLMSSVIAAWEHKVPVEMIILFPLVMSFLRKSSVEIDVAHALIPDQFVIDLGQRRAFWDNDRIRERKIDIKDAFADASSLMGSIQEATRYGNDDGQSETRNYVRDTFVPEWNGKPRIAGQVSIQADLPRLIAYAGNFVAEATA